MTCGRIPEITKSPNETYPVGFKYLTPDIDEGAYLVSCVVSIEPSEVGGLALSGNAVIEPDIVSQMITGGEAGVDYKVFFKTTTSGGHIYEDCITVKVREC